MSNARDNSSGMGRNGDFRSVFLATQDESAAFSQPSTARSSPFNSFIVEYDLDTMNLYGHNPKGTHNRGLKESAASGELESTGRNKNPAMQPPPPQLIIGSTGGEYDPNRIPGIAFSSKSTIPVEWSVASNESLFSIQMGNASFNRDHPTFFHKSQELTKYDDTIHLSSPASQAQAVDGQKHKIMLNQSRSLVLPENLDDQKKESEETSADGSGVSSTPHHNSTGSHSGLQPFSFPILDNAGGRNSLEKLGAAEIKKQKSQLASPKTTQHNEVAMITPAAVTPTGKKTSWFFFSCCQG
uniref:Uncharacterized protein n=1 Tax=Kalanchoe fedtschenkoi TaxID=63787 RepID=A0A7N0T8G2_KALFE